MDNLYDILWLQKLLQAEERRFTVENAKVCTCCNQEKDLSEFPIGRYRKRTNDYYIKTQCRECSNKKAAIRMKERRESRTEEEKKHFRDYQNNWNRQNRDKVAAFQKRYFGTEKGKEKNREAQRRFRAKQKGKMKNERTNTEI
ncbi:hypothetical protein MCCARTNEY_175 [Bacillus phage vB_BanH_McCartney]|nr:hypothetical protein MCCARTNEY_175 [Bacillus phage vB_BanH_McCartney]